MNCIPRSKYIAISIFFCHPWVHNSFLALLQGLHPWTDIRYLLSNSYTKQLPMKLKKLQWTHKGNPDSKLFLTPLQLIQSHTTTTSHCYTRRDFVLFWNNKFSTEYVLQFWRGSSSVLYNSLTTLVYFHAVERSDIHFVSATRPYKFLNFPQISIRDALKTQYTLRTY